MPGLVRRSHLILLVGVALALLARPALAQETPPPLGPAAGALLPSGADLGPRWEVVHTRGLEAPSDLFREGAVGSYVGPAGARVLAVVLLSTQARVAVRRSWEEALDLFGEYAGELAYARGRDEELDQLPPPLGCVEAKRIDGTAKQLGLETGIPLGITLCAADPDLIVLVVVSGALGELTGYAASDAVASAMVARGAPAVATPAP